MYWLDNQWQTPDLVCQYLMRVCCEIRRVLSKNPNAIRDEHFKIEYVNKNSTEDYKPTEAEIATATMNAKSKWFGIAGLLNRNKKQP